MDLVEVTPGIYQATASHVSWLLVEEGGSVTLVDTGWPKDYERIVASLERIGRTPADVHAIVLTHAHIDHMGAAEELRSNHGIPVMTLRQEEPMARGRVHEAITTMQVLKQLWRPTAFRFAVSSIGRGLSATPLGEVETFEEGEALDIPGGPTPIFMPGHTSGSAAYNFEHKGVLMTGDALVTVNLFTGNTGPQLMPRDFNANHEQARESLQRLIDVRANVIVPGHGEMYNGTPERAVEEALDRA